MEHLTQKFKNINWAYWKWYLTGKEKYLKEAMNFKYQTTRFTEFD